ncbi:MAG: hypothetical protein OXL34_10865 [Gemmatimonadota bacterium]|nr:hypothetical protein [Gemmatimonadota bacterium]
MTTANKVWMDPLPEMQIDAVAAGDSPHDPLHGGGPPRRLLD